MNDFSLRISKRLQKEIFQLGTLFVGSWLILITITSNIEEMFSSVFNGLEAMVATLLLGVLLIYISLHYGGKK